MSGGIGMNRRFQITFVNDEYFGVLPALVCGFACLDITDELFNVVHTRCDGSP